MARVVRATTQPKKQHRESPQVAVILGVTAALPLALMPRLFLGYSTTPKLVVLFVAAALMKVTAEQWWPAVLALWQTTPGRRLYVLILAQASSLVISSACSKDVLLAIGGTTWRRFGALTEIAILFIVAVMAADVCLRRSARTVMTAIEAAGAVAAMYGILQYFGFDPLLPAQLYTTRFTADVVRPPSSLGHALYFANFLVPVTIIAAWRLITELSDDRRKWSTERISHAAELSHDRREWSKERIGHALVLVLALAAMALSGARSAVLGLVAGAALICYLQARYFRNRKIVLYVAACGLAATMLAAAFAFSSVGQSFRIRLTQWVQDSKGGPRLMVWRDSWPLVKTHWIIGSGPETFAGDFRKVQSAELSRAYPDHYHESPHNLFLEVWISQGTLGLMLLLATTSLGIVCGFQDLRRGGVESGAVLGSLIGMIISLQFSPLTIVSWLYLCAAIAVTVALATSHKKAALDSIKFRPASKAALMLGALLAVGTAGVYAAQDACVAETGLRLAKHDVDGACRSYNIMQRFPFPADSLWCSQQMALLASSLPPPGREKALALAKAASADAEQSAEQRFNALYQSAVLALVSNDISLAETKLRLAVNAAPCWYRPHMMLASILWITGRNQEAVRERDLAVEYAGTHAPEIKSALQRTMPLGASLN